MNIDILKFLVIFVALLYFNLKVKPHTNKTNFLIMNIGLCLLLFASILDFADGIKSLDNFPILGNDAPFHDVLEDQFFDTPGLALLLFGVIKEVTRKR